MILYRVFPQLEGARASETGGALYFPRMFQGAGRHDNRSRYGCLYASELAISPVTELLSQHGGRSALLPETLMSSGMPLALATIELSPGARLIDLDEPRVLEHEGLRPSIVATASRPVTQEYAATIYERHRDAAGLRWWSTLEASWPNITLFGRARPRLKVRATRLLDVSDPLVQEAAGFLGLSAR